MATLTVYRANVSGSANVPVYVAVSASDEFTNTGKEFLHVKNANASPTVVAVNSLVNCNQGFDHDVSVSVPNGSERLIGPFDPARFTLDATQRATVTFSVTASVTVSVLANG